MSLNRSADRLAPILIAAAVLVVGLTARTLAFPGSAFACSCAGEPRITGEEDAVFIGTAGAPQPDGTYAFSVERWFKGGPAPSVRVTSERIVFADGSTATNTCGLHFEVGDRLVLVAAIGDGVLSPGTCSPHATVESPEGQQLLEAAKQKFGEGEAPGDVSGEDPGGGGIDLAALALGAVGLVLVALVVAVAVVIGLARRGSAGEADS